MPATIISTPALAERSPWKLLQNATLIFRRPITLAVNPATGNEEPETWEELTARAYIKKAKALSMRSHNQISSGSGTGVPVVDYTHEGYTVGILPEWAKNPTQPRVQCTIDGLGSGYFYFEGKIHVVKQQVEKAGKGSQIQGNFVIQGSGV